MGVIICPKCGRVQDTGPECRWCGLVFERYHPPRPPTGNHGFPGDLLRCAYRVMCWASLGLALLAMLLVLHQSPAPQVDTTVEAGSRAQAKIVQFQNASGGTGRIRTLRMNEAELNSWLSSQMALDAEAPGRETPDQDPDRPSNIRDLRVKLLDDGVRAYIGFDFHGKELSLELEGRVEAHNGYLRLEPSAGKLGALPLPASALESAAARIFDSQQNRQKFRIPDEIRDIRVEGRELIIEAR